MVMRVVELKTQIMLSTRFTERFRGKITDPSMAPTSFFGIPEAAGPAETENHKPESLPLPPTTHSLWVSERFQETLSA